MREGAPTILFINLHTLIGYTFRGNNYFFHFLLVCSIFYFQVNRNSFICSSLISCEREDFFASFTIG